LISSVPNPYPFKETLRHIFDVLDKSGPVSSWAKQTFQKLLKSCGFESVSIDGTHLIPGISRNGFCSHSFVYKLRK
jgi:hypothetical protein